MIFEVLNVFSASSAAVYSAFSALKRNDRVKLGKGERERGRFEMLEVEY